ncbi:hypothetical protein FD13_GL000464 [Levilactobacillus senmaizukei DSM 21775 = NBRC 103853]|uniref:Uncharacterized protein n=1 Tax=Levilactobacillus senmaizukei DSM 21775 = NBRC 103853 TaxID=1423803 RepID=A0A0R2DJL8_9LACO|nr:hypothetical protein [Levilactobacillus senmaizukei]KRN01877.1 hypothetical protein FD13_GL000464 [Levilactobacillus senmaizukei DSM 21775 = NBRC 103853]
MAKHKLLAGLVLGGAAVAAYHALDLEQREALKDACRERVNALKDRAVDYAFYAADAADDFKESLNDHLAAKTDAPAWQTLNDDDTADDADDDIVLKSAEVADLNDNAAGDDEASDDTVDPTDDTSDSDAD